MQRLNNRAASGDLEVAAGPKKRKSLIKRAAEGAPSSRPIQLTRCWSRAAAAEAQVSDQTVSVAATPSLAGRA